MRSTGEKKCTPMKLSGRSLASARPVIGKVDVFEPNTAAFGITAQAFFVASAFTARSSNTASTMKSTFLRSAKSAVGWMRDRISAFFSGVERPFSIWRSMMPPA